MSNIFQVQAVIPFHGIRSMSDGGLRLIVDCQEMSPEDEAKILGLRGKLGWFVFSEDTIKQEDIKPKNRYARLCVLMNDLAKAKKTTFEAVDKSVKEKNNVTSKKDLTDQQINTITEGIERYLGIRPPNY